MLVCRNIRTGIVLWLMILTLCCSAASAVVYICPQGDDNWPGTYDQPFATIERAARALAEVQTTADGPATVILRQGRYSRDSAFILTDEHSGTARAPVIFKTHPNETAILDGGYSLCPDSFSQVSDPNILSRLLPEVRGKVLKADLKAQGITEYGQVGPRGWGRRHIPAPMELFIDGLPQRLARWPNQGHIQLGKVLQEGKNDHPGQFKYNTDRADRWVSADKAYISGLFGVSWAHDTIAVAEIDTQTQTITTASGHAYGFAQPGFGGIETQYHIVNLLEEIQEPGEYYIDRRQGVLYLLPAYPLKHSKIQLSHLAEPMVDIQNASHIRFEGIIFENARGPGISVRGGTNIEIAGCTIRQTGDVGIQIFGGTSHSVLSCDIYHTGRGGLTVTGGDREKLTPAKHLVANCDIHSYNRWLRYYNPAVSVAGVGITLRNNHMHRAKHQAITFSGNDHSFEFNEIHHVLKDISDMGSIYVGRNPTYAGNNIAYNFFHHLSDHHSGGHGTQAIFFDDDTLHAAKVFGNTFYRTGSTGVIKFHGGGGASIANNIAVKCPQLVEEGPGDKAGIERAVSKMHTDQPHQHGFPEMVAQMNIGQPPYRSRYPYLYKTYAKHFNPGTPKWNNYQTENLRHFVDPANMNFQIKSDSPILEKIAGGVFDHLFELDGCDMPFEPIPFDKIGLQPDSYRTLTGPAPFSKLGPADEAIVEHENVLIWWKPAHNADSYSLIIAGDAQMREILARHTVKNNYFRLTNLKPGTKYYWQVHAQITKSRSNRYSRQAKQQSRQFTTKCPN